ncbi:MAG TPA: hypothetical protein VK983_05195 [Candidatus Limnocylindrales bacterium]|nr:hypothetical protein [Candidatus Limnocylindrales bacterium]
MNRESSPLPRFRDPSFLDERSGFETGRFGAHHLPGETWAEGNMFDSAVFFTPNCNMEDAVFSDKVWRDGSPDRLRALEEPDGRLLGELFYNDAIRRLQAIEQLTLPPKYSTIPNTGAFSRFEHIWGSALFVRQMCHKHGITGREASKLLIRTLLSDVGQTIGSHLGDWMFQGVGGAENQHDMELADYLETVGINDILRRHDYDPADVTFPDIEDWVEAPQPDLCVDRVDYGLREMNRWNTAVRMQGFKADDFTITPDGMLAMTDQRRARIFAEGFLLLSQEHWSEPTHRLMIDLLMLRTKLFYGEGRTPRTWVFEPLPKMGLVDLYEIHPRDLMYVTDPAQEHAYAFPDLGGHTIEAIMTSIARYRRQYVWPGRRNRIYNYMEQFTDSQSYQDIQASGSYKPLEHEDFGSYQDEYPQTLPAGFAILDAAEAEATQHDYFIDIPQPPFKTRQIDPLVQTADGFARLSELDPSYGDRLAEYKRILLAPKVARLAIVDPKTQEMMRNIIDNVEESWQQRIAQSRRMTPDELRSLVKTSASELYGSYPFMTFLEY